VLSPEGPQADEGQPANTLLPERAEVKPQIPDSAEQFRGHYYDVFETPMTWHCARDFCQRLGGHLARVQSAEEQDFVAGLVGKKADFWVDGSDELEEGVWKFSDGRPCTFTNWQKGQPSNRDGKQHVLMVRADHNGQWNDGHSAARKPFVCEWDPERGSAPTPSEPPGGRTAEPEDTASFGGHRYKLYESTVPRHIAREQCRTMGGHLAQIESAEEQKFIEELLRPGEQKLYWVDGSDAAAEGEWTFSDGSKISYTNWASKEPNNSDKVQHSLNIYRENGKHGKWDDCGAGVRCGFIAEWDR